MKILVENSSNIGETVLDQFVGVGSTGVACKELDKQYFDIATKRIC